MIEADRLDIFGIFAVVDFYVNRVYAGKFVVGGKGNRFVCGNDNAAFVIDEFFVREYHVYVVFVDKAVGVFEAHNRSGHVDGDGRQAEGA